MKPYRLLAVLFLATITAFAQLAGPNAQGVAMGHIHLNSADPDVAIAFWKDVLNASSYTHETLQGVSMLGAIILFTKKAPTAPSAGSTVDHLALTVPDLQPFQEKLAKTSYKNWQPVPGGDKLLIDGPDGVRIELVEDNAMYAPVEFNHLHFHAPDPKKVQAWYAEHFGAKEGKRGEAESADLPGGSIEIDPGEAAPTVGRAIDHIGFEIKGLEAFCKKLSDSGLKLDTPYRTIDQLKLSLAFLTDPWGTRIELTEGLAK